MITPKNDVLPSIPDKRYFTIGEASDLCLVKPHVLRYWEQEFGVLKPVKRRGNRRYYQRKDIELIRQIRDLLYSKGFTIQGARKELAQLMRATPTVSESFDDIEPTLETALKSIPASIVFPAMVPPSPVFEKIQVSKIVEKEAVMAKNKEETVNQLIHQLESLLAEINI